MAIECGSYQDQQTRSKTWTAGTPPVVVDRRAATPEAAETGYYPIWDESWNTKHSAYRTTTHELQFKSTGGRVCSTWQGSSTCENKQIRYDMEMLTNKSWYEDSGCRWASSRTVCRTRGCSTGDARRPQRRRSRSSTSASWKRSASPWVTLYASRRLMITA